MAERTAALTPLAFPLPAGSFRGVLEATQEDMRAGVFTIDLLFSFSCVASVKLQTHKIMCYMGNARSPAGKKRSTHRTLILRMERMEGLNAASSFPAGFGGALVADSIVFLRLSSAALLLGAGLIREARVALCREKHKQVITFTSFLN